MDLFEDVRLSLNESFSLPIVGNGSMCPGSRVWGAVLARPLRTKPWLSADELEYWQARTIEVQGQHVLLPFLIVPASENMIGPGAANRLMEIGAQRARHSRHETEIVTGITIQYPHYTETSIEIFPPGSRFGSDLDIRNNAIGGMAARLIARCDSNADQICKGYSKVPDELEHFKNVFPDLDNQQYAAELDLVLQSPRTKQFPPPDKYIPALGGPFVPLGKGACIQRKEPLDFHKVEIRFHIVLVLFLLLYYLIFFHPILNYITKPMRRRTPD